MRSIWFSEQRFSDMGQIASVNASFADLCPTDFRTAHDMIASEVQSHLEQWMREINYTTTVFPWAISAIGSLRWGGNILRTGSLAARWSQFRSYSHNKTENFQLYLNALEEVQSNFERYGDFASDFDLDLQFTGEDWSDDAEFRVVRELRHALAIQIPGIPKSWLSIPRCLVGRKPHAMFRTSHPLHPRRNQLVCFTLWPKAPLHVWFGRPEWTGYHGVRHWVASWLEPLDIFSSNQGAASLFRMLACGIGEESQRSCHVTYSQPVVQDMLANAIVAILNPVLSRLMAIDFWVPQYRGDPTWKPDFSGKKIRLGDKGWLVPENMVTRLLSQSRTGFGKYLTSESLQVQVEDLKSVDWKHLSTWSLAAIARYAGSSNQLQHLKSISKVEKAEFIRSLSPTQKASILEDLLDKDRELLVFCRVFYHRGGPWPEDAGDEGFQRALNEVILPACQEALHKGDWLNFAHSFGCRV